MTMTAKRIFCVGKIGPAFGDGDHVIGERRYLTLDRRYRTGYKVRREAIVRVSAIFGALWDAGWRP